ncbi:unnamed protein product [Gadus morhua 'NCC']
MNQVHQAHLLLAEGKQVLELHQYPLQLQLLLVAQPPHCSASRSPSSQTAGLLFPLFSGRSAGCSTLQLGVDTGRRPRSPSPEAPLSPGPVLFLGMNRGSTCNEFPNRQQHSQAVHSHRIGLLDFSGSDRD